jgi:tellurite resistance-related uncharacterized protein
MHHDLLEAEAALGLEATVLLVAPLVVVHRNKRNTTCAVWQQLCMLNGNASVSVVRAEERQASAEKRHVLDFRLRRTS